MSVFVVRWWIVLVKLKLSFPWDDYVMLFMEWDDNLFIDTLVVFQDCVCYVELEEHLARR